MQSACRSSAAGMQAVQLSCRPNAARIQPRCNKNAATAMLHTSRPAHASPVEVACRLSAAATQACNGDAGPVQRECKPGALECKHIEIRMQAPCSWNASLMKQKCRRATGVQVQSNLNAGPVQQDQTPSAPTMQALCSFNAGPWLLECEAVAARMQAKCS